MEYTKKEMMAIALSREIQDKRTYIIGTGLPLIGAILAKNTHAPDVRLLFESGIVGGDPKEVATSVSDLRLCHEASTFWPPYRYVGFQSLVADSDLIEAGFLGGAQIDPYGNLNSTAIGDYLRPVTRLSGSGGANGIATYCNTVIVMKHQKKRFVEKVDYCTSPGWIDGPGGRSRMGLREDKGPRAVITDLGVFRFGADKRMYLAEFFPGVDPEEIQENTGFVIDISKAVESAPPTSEALYILEEKVDPGRMMT